MATYGYHFCRQDRHLRFGDNRLVEPGITHSVEGPIVLCERGLHQSPRIMTALRYATGPVLSRVVGSGESVIGADKSAHQHRRYLWVFDASHALREFAATIAKQALDRERAAGREPHPDSWRAVEVALAHSKGEATDEELAAAYDAACAAEAAVDYAYNAACAADIAYDYAYDAVRAAGYAADYAAAAASTYAAEAAAAYASAYAGARAADANAMDAGDAARAADADIASAYAGAGAVAAYASAYVDARAAADAAAAAVAGIREEQESLLQSIIAKHRKSTR